MRVQSKTIDTFIKRLHHYLKEILTNEVGVNVFRSRFLYQNYYYPISIVVFEDKTQLGFFDYELSRIGINKNLMYSAKTGVLKNILRHELAHYLVAVFKLPVDGHGQNFKNICKNFHWGEDVSLATMDLIDANNQIEGEIHTEELLSRIKKLLNLAESQNSFEAESALLKANQLILKHQLQNIPLHNENVHDEIFNDVIISKPRNCQKLTSIYEIIKTFMVYPVFNYGKNNVYLEVTGQKNNIELARYVADYLDREFEVLWDQAKHESHLKGKNQKNSFFQGVTSGYLEKNKLDKKNLNEYEIKTLIVLEKKLEIENQFFYPRLGSKRSNSNLDIHSKKVGEIFGKKLTINKALSNSFTKLLEKL